MNSSELTIKVTGEAGLGVQTIGNVLCRVFKSAGYHLFSTQDYMSRIRGGNNFIQMRVAQYPVFSCDKLSNITIALDKASLPIHQSMQENGGVIILDKLHLGISDNSPSFFHAPLYSIAEDIGKNNRYVNSVACGVLCGMVHLPFILVKNVLERSFSGKGTGIAEINVAVALAGYEFATSEFKNSSFTLNAMEDHGHLLLEGNEALALGAIQAGCRFYSAYPMSPSTSIMETLAHYAEKTGMVVEQAEDEIAAVNMVIGASYAGVRAMTGTSGGGFALMSEGLSLAAMTETPLVIVDAQRPGPATGFPTRTEQADLDFLIHAGHGEFARVIYSPGTAEEAFFLTQKAFDMAEKYQIPVIIMTDQHFADSARTVEKEDLEFIGINRHLISMDESGNTIDYKRYKFTDSGISPRAVPSFIQDVVYSDSDEHTEEGHITEDAGIRVKMVEKRFTEKTALLEKDIIPPVAYFVEDAELILMGFGSTYGSILDAVKQLGDPKIGFIHLPQVWPFPKSALFGFLQKDVRIITVENNAGGQLAKLILRETGITPNGSILKFDGRPFDPDYLISKIREL